MRRVGSWFLSILGGGIIALAGTAIAAGPGGEGAVDLTAYPTKVEMQSTLSAMQQQIPQPAVTVPPTEMTGGTVGSPGTYRPADARTPRITRSKTVVLAADGTATFDWSAQGALANGVQLAITPVYTGNGVPKCYATAVTATSASIKCVIEAVALLSVAGINIGSVTNTNAGGISVGIIALPTS